MKPLRHYLFGIVVSFLLAALLAFLGISLVSNPNLGWGAQALLSYGLLFGGPLAVVLALCWIVYMVRDKGQVPGRVHALLLAPTALALAIVPVSDSIDRSRQDSFRASNPAIQEVHVNLSGRSIGLDMREASTSSGGARSTMEPGSAEQRMYSSFPRYPGQAAIASGNFPYEGARLKDSVDHYQYFNPDGTPGASLPLRRLPYPDLGKLPSAYPYGEAGLVVYQYFHYADHVEVAPGIARFSGMTRIGWRRRASPGWRDLRPGKPYAADHRPRGDRMARPTTWARMPRAQPGVAAL